MKERLVIHLKNGDTVEGRLSGTLGSSSVDIEIFAEVENRVLLFALDEICAISFVGTPDWLVADEPTVPEEVQITTGETYKVKVCTKRKFLKGFIALLLDETLPYKTIFFTFSGVRSRSETRCIGEILQEEGLVDDESVHEVLKKQEALRQRLIGDAIAETANLSQDAIESTIQDATEKSGTPRDARVGDILVDAGLVTREQVEKAFESQEKGKKIKVGELLVKQGLVIEEQLLSALATKFRLRFINLETVLPCEEALGALSEGLVNRLQVFPVDFDGRRLVVATSAPTDPTVGDSLRFSTNQRIELVVATARLISEAIEKYYYRDKSEIESLLKAMKEEAQSVTVEEVGPTQRIMPCGS